MERTTSSEVRSANHDIEGARGRGSSVSHSQPAVPLHPATSRLPAPRAAAQPAGDQTDSDTWDDQLDQLDAAVHQQPVESARSETVIEPGMALDDAAADDQADDDTPEDGAESGDGAETAENDGQEASTFLVRDVVRAGETPGTFIIGHLVIVIDEEISALLPKKSAEEYRRLVEQTRVERGCRNDIVVCQLPGQDPDKYSLADGEHRIKASCETQGFCGVRLIHLTDRAAVERWVRENQLAQRNLCDDARAYYYGREYLENLGHQGERNDLSGQNVRRHTGEEVAAEAQTNERTIRRWADFAKSLDELTAQCGPAIRQKVLAGQVKSAQSVIARIIKLPRGQRRAPVRHVVEHGTMPPAERTAPSFVEKLTRTWEKAEEDDRRQFLQALLADEEFAQMIADLQEQADDD